jgi:hypothetical protein
MTTIFALLLVAAALQQPERPARRPAPPPVSRSPASPAPAPNASTAQAGDPPRKTAFDTTAGAISDVGRAVADVRAELDRFQVTASNDPGGTLLEYAGVFQAKCRELATTAQRSSRVMCRRCVGGGAQPAIDQYRAYLPTLAQTASRCAATLQRLRRGDDAAAAAALRRGRYDISQSLIAGLRAYEARLSRVLSVLRGQPATQR